MGFSATSERAPSGETVVTFSGRLEPADAGRMRQLLFGLIADGAHTIAVDLTRATTVDATAAGVFILADNALRRAGGALRVVGNGNGAAVERLLRLGGTNGKHTDRT